MKYGGNNVATHLLPSTTWPDDCHGCGVRMDFEWHPDTERIRGRRCPACGATVRVTQGSKGCELVLSPVKRRRTRRKA